MLVGITSRISAEIISGLNEGDRVVAGILQGDIPIPGNTGDQRRQMFRAMQGFR